MGVRTVEITRVNGALLFCSAHSDCCDHQKMSHQPDQSPFSFPLSQGPTDALGISIAGGKGSPLGDIPIFVAMIQANGVAAKTHRLKVRVSVCVCVSVLLSPYFL